MFSTSQIECTWTRSLLSGDLIQPFLAYRLDTRLTNSILFKVIDYTAILYVLVLLVALLLPLLAVNSLFIS